MMRIVAFLLFTLVCLSPARTAMAADVLVFDEPAIIPSDELRQDLNRALLAVVMKIRGHSAVEIAGMGVDLTEPALKNLTDKSILLAPFTLKEARLSTLLPGSKKGRVGGRAVGIYAFEDDFLRQLELAFAFDYHITEAGRISLNWASVGENSPLPPVVSLYVVAKKDMPANFGSDFHTWQDIFSFAILKGLDLANPDKLPKGKQGYTVFQFVHSRLPSGDWIGAVASDSSEGQGKEKGKLLISTFDGWKIFRHQIEMDLTSGPPVYFKTLYKPTHTGTKEFDGKTLTVATFTPHQGGKMIGGDKPAAPRFQEVADVPAASAKEKTAPVAEGEEGIGGLWNTPEWKANLDLWTQGDRLVGYYKPSNDRGWLWAEETRDGYEGLWVETYANEKCATQKNNSYYWGRVTLDFKGDQMAGKWSYCDKPPEKAWTAQRIGDARKFGLAPNWSLFDEPTPKAASKAATKKAKMKPGKISPISDDGKVRLEVIDPKEGFRLINEDYGYSLLPPFDNWAIAKPDEDGNMIIHEQGGCMMSFMPASVIAEAPQTSPGAFEAYWWKSLTDVNEGKGAKRHTPSSLSINGLDALSVRYDTKDGPWHFNIIQLPHRLLISAFTCRKAGFEGHYAKFEKAVSTMKALSGAPASKPAKAKPQPKPKPATTQKPPKPTDAGGPQRFAEPGFGYTMPYPPNWVYEKPSRWTAVFSGPKGTDAYYTTVTVQNLSAKTYADMNAVVADLKAQLKASGKKHRWHNTLPYLHMDDAGNVQGKQFTMEYWEGKEKLRRTGVLIPRLEQGVYHYFSYTAPEALYGESHDLAEAMRDGFQRVGGGAPAAAAPKPQGKKTSGHKRVFNEIDGYSVIPPAGWNVTERQRNSVINMTNGNCELRFSMGNIGNKDLNTYADKWENVSVRPDYMFKKRLNREALRVNGLDAIVTEYDMGPNTGLMYFVRLPKEVLGIRATCKKGPLAQVFSEVEYAVNSVTALAQ